jgi:hypothetical protein
MEREISSCLYFGADHPKGDLAENKGWSSGEPQEEADTNQPLHGGLSCASRF